MDPLSIAASTAGLIGLTITLIKLVDNLSSVVAKKSQLMLAIGDELKLLRTVLDDLSSITDPTKGNDADASALSLVLQGCEKVMLQLQNELTALHIALTRGRIARAHARLTLTNRFDFISDLGNQLDKYKSTLIIALTLRTAKAVSAQDVGASVDKLRNEIATSAQSTTSTGQWQNPIQQYLAATAGIKPVRTVSHGDRGQSSATMSRATTLVDASDDSKTISSAAATLQSQPVILEHESFDDWLLAAVPAEEYNVDSSAHTATVSQPQKSTSISRKSGIPRPPSASIPVARPKPILTQPDAEISRETTYPMPPQQVMPHSQHNQPVCFRVEGLKRLNGTTTEEVILTRKDPLAAVVQELRNRGYNAICGFKINDAHIPLHIEHSNKLDVPVTDGPSCYDILHGLKINVNEPFNVFYDRMCAVLDNDAAEQLSLQVKQDTLAISQQDGELELSFARTLRVPENGKTFGAPVLFAPMPLIPVSEHKLHLPSQIAQKGGLLLPMYQREAIALNLNTSMSASGRTARFAIKVLAGTINVLNETVKNQPDLEKGQDYVIAPGQARLDGFVAARDLVNQFVGMSLGSGYTAEGQLTGKETFGGMQLIIAPRLRGSYDPLFEVCMNNRILPAHACVAQFRDAPNNYVELTGVTLVEQSKRLFNMQQQNKGVDEDLKMVPPESRLRLTHELPGAAYDGLKTVSLEAVYLLDIEFVSTSGSYLPYGVSAARMRPAKLCLPKDKRKITLSISPFLEVSELYHLLQRAWNADLVVLFRDREKLACTTPGRHRCPIHHLISQSCRLSCQLYKDVPEPDTKDYDQSQPNIQIVTLPHLPPCLDPGVYAGPSPASHWNAKSSQKSMFRHRHQVQPSAPSSESSWTLSRPSYAHGRPEDSANFGSVDEPDVHNDYLEARHRRDYYSSPLLTAETADPSKSHLPNPPNNSGQYLPYNSLRRPVLSHTVAGRPEESRPSAANGSKARLIARLQSGRDDKAQIESSATVKNLETTDTGNEAVTTLSQTSNSHVQRWEMGLAAGGLIHQGIVEDPYRNSWDWSRACFINIQFVNSLIFEKLTNIPAPPAPVSFKDYIDAGLPFFHLVQNNVIDGSEVLATLKSVGSLDSQRGISVSARVRKDLVPTKCALCENNLSDTIIRPCNHIFCGMCIRDSMMTGDELDACGACGTSVTACFTFAGNMEAPKVGLPTITKTSSADVIAELPTHDLVSTQRTLNAAADTEPDSSKLDTGPETAIHLVSQKSWSTSDDYGSSGVHVSKLLTAVGANDLAAVEHVLTSETNTPDAEAVLLAASLGHCDMLFLLSEHGVGMDLASGPDDYHPIHEATRCGKTAAVAILLGLGVDIESQSGHIDVCRRLTPAQVAAKYGQVNTLRFLLARGARMYQEQVGQHDCEVKNDV